MTVNAGIDERYGRTPTRRLRDRRLLWVFGALFAVVLVAWVVWAGTDAPSSQLEARDTRHEILDEHSVKVTFEVSMPVNTSASCAVEALNEGFTVVDIPPSDSYTRSFTETVRTTELSNTGLIYRCWLT